MPQKPARSLNGSYLKRTMSKSARSYVKLIRKGKHLKVHSLRIILTCIGGKSEPTSAPKEPKEPSETEKQQQQPTKEQPSEATEKSEKKEVPPPTEKASPAKEQATKPTPKQEQPPKPQATPATASVPGTREERRVSCL